MAWRAWIRARHLSLLGPDQVLLGWSSPGGQQLGDLFEAEPGSLAEHYYRQAVDGAGVVLAAQPGALDAADEPMALVVVQGGGGQPGLGADLADVEQMSSHGPQL